MEKLLISHPDEHTSAELTFQIQAAFKASLEARDWPSIEKVVEASRTTVWRAPLCHLVLPFLKAINKDDVIAVRLVVRLAANCVQCDDDISFEVQSELVQNYLDIVHLWLAKKELFDVTVGLVNNLLNACDEPPLELSDLINHGFQETIAIQLLEADPTIPLDGLSVDLLEELARVDALQKIPDPSKSAAATKALLKLLLSRNGTARTGDYQLTNAILWWTCSEKVLATLDEQTLNDPPKDEPFVQILALYDTLLQRYSARLEHIDMLELFEAYQNVLAEVGTKLKFIPRDELTIKLLTVWINGHDCTLSQRKLAEGGYMALSNIIRDDDAAVEVVRRFDLISVLVNVLTTPSWIVYAEICLPATAVLANLAVPTENKEAIAKSAIIRSLFLDVSNVDPALSVHILRKLVCNNEILLAAMMTDDSAEANGVVTLDDLNQVLPDQQILQGQIQSGRLDTGRTSDQAISIDVGHILVALLRFTHKTDQSAITTTSGALDVTEEHIWCLVNLLQFGLRSRGTRLIGESLLGLALALRQDDPTRKFELSLAATEVLKWTQFKSFKAVLSMAKDDAYDRAKQDAENAMFVLTMLREVAVEEELSCLGVIDELLRYGSA